MKLLLLLVLLIAVAWFVFVGLPSFLDRLLHPLAPLLGPLDRYFEPFRKALWGSL